MENKRKRIEEIKLEALKIKTSVLSTGNKLPIHVDILHVLTELDRHLMLENLDKQKMEKYSFGIFRLTTENYTLEKSDLGQNLLNLQKNIRRFLHDFYEAA